MSTTENCTVEDQEHNAKIDMRRFIDALHAPGATIELRALNVPDGKWKNIVSGYYRDRQKLVEDASRLTTSGNAGGVYVIMNEVNPDLHARCADRCARIQDGNGTKNADVVRRRYLLVDCDPERAEGISSTNAEHESALKAARWVRDELSTRGWPAPIATDSGNGAGLLYKIDLPAEDSGIVKRVLAALNFLFSDQCVKIDTSVENAARLTRLPGTVNRKGDDIPERPHRWAQLLEIPASLEVVPLEKLEELAKEMPEPEKRKDAPWSRSKANDFDLDAFMVKHFPDARGPTDVATGRKWELAGCPFTIDGGHERKAFIFQHSTGGISAGCQADGCAGARAKGNHWKELWTRLDPDAYGGRKRRGRRRKDAEDSDDGAASAPAKERPTDPREVLLELAGELSTAADDERKGIEKELLTLLDVNSIRITALAILAEDPPTAKAHQQRELAKVMIDNFGFAPTLADVVMYSDHFALDVGRLLYVFRDGVYRGIGDVHVRQRVQALLERWTLTGEWFMRRGQETVEYITLRSPDLWVTPPVEIINLKNGLLHWRTKKLEPHDPNFFSPVQLPISFDPEAKCIAWETFVEEVFPDDSRDLAWMLTAWIMVPERCIQKAVMLVGSGGNGKSTFLSGLTAFVGRDNVVNLPLQKLEEGRFAAASLAGKLANICPDLPTVALSSSSTFKAITGGDRIDAERKFKDHFFFDPYARLLFSCNEPPQASDTTEAFWERWIVLEFTRKFRGSADEIPRSKLDAQLADPQELSGVLNKAIAVLPTILEHGFTETPSMRAARDSFEERASPVRVFLRDEVLEDAGLMVSKSALLRAFTEWGRVRSIPTPNSTSLALAIHRAKPGIQDARRTWNGVESHVWLGIGLRAHGQEAHDHQQGA